MDTPGYLAGLGALLMWLPRGWHVVRGRDEGSPEGVSAYATVILFNTLLLIYGIGTHATMSNLTLVTYGLATTQAVFWVIYGFATNRLPIGIPKVFIAPACSYILILALRSRRAARASLASIHRPSLVVDEIRSS